MDMISDSDLTEEQLRGIQAFADWYKKGRKEGFKQLTFKIGGPAGSGKSTVAYFALQLAGLNVHSSRIVKVAYTGKAALVMSNKGLTGSQTIHKAIYIPVDEVGDAVKEMRSRLLKLRGTIGGVDPADRPKVAAEIELLSTEIKTLQDRTSDEMMWVLNRFCSAADADLILCDEASMVGGKIQLDLESLGVPILYLGDGFQLSPILSPKETNGSVFFDVNGRPLTADYQLLQIHRQAEGSPIIRYSRALRENRRDELRFVGTMKSDTGTLIRIPKDRITLEHLAKAEQIITGYNDTRQSINTQIREYLGRETAYPEAGDRIIFTRNNKDYRITNGQMAAATESYYDFDSRSNTFVVDLLVEDGRQMSIPLLVPPFQNPGDSEAIYSAPGWSRKKNVHADYAWAISCHKSQGSQYNSGIIINEPFGKDAEDKRRWEYTALTRMANSAIVAI